MTKEQLLQPRYRVIADYPSQQFKIGDIIEDKGNVEAHYQTGFYFCLRNNTEAIVQDPEKYPAIFEKVFWWEKRKEEDMPMYIKIDWTIAGIDGSDQYWKIKKWDFKGKCAWIDNSKDETEGVVSFNKCMLPSTEEEFNLFISGDEKKKKTKKRMLHNASEIKEGKFLPLKNMRKKIYFLLIFLLCECVGFVRGVVLKFKFLFFVRGKFIHSFHN